MGSPTEKRDCTRVSANDRPAAIHKDHGVGGMFEDGVAESCSATMGTHAVGCCTAHHWMAGGTIWRVEKRTCSLCWFGHEIRSPPLGRHGGAASMSNTSPEAGS